MYFVIPQIALKLKFPVALQRPNRSPNAWAGWQKYDDERGPSKNISVLPLKLILSDYPRQPKQNRICAIKFCAAIEKMASLRKRLPSLLHLVSINKRGGNEDVMDLNLPFVQLGHIESVWREQSKDGKRDIEHPSFTKTWKMPYRAFPYPKCHYIYIDNTRHWKGLR